MDLVFIVDFLKILARECWKHRFWVLFSGFFIALGTLVFGALWEEKYNVEATLYADQQNIIAPLLAGQASVTEVVDQLQVVKDLMLSERILNKIVKGEMFLNGIDDPEKETIVTEELRNALDVKSLGKNYIGVSYSNADQDIAYNVVADLIDLFIKESSEAKQSESKQAFMFIDKQVNSYKEQLRLAEEKLKNFKATNLEGNESQVQRAVEEFRSAVSTLELDLDQANERVKALEYEVSSESRYLSQKARSEEYRERILTAVNQLDQLLLDFTESHPDVISMRERIKALEAEARRADESGGLSVSVGPSRIENPVYDDLRTSLAQAKVERDTLQKRINAVKLRIAEETLRRKRIAEKAAEEAELTRDYNVIKVKYEDLLESKENARLSMTLDIEGQGLSYKIQEPPKYPLLASGLRFMHFILIGCAAALVLPIGLVVLYIFLDPRVRFPAVLDQEFDVPLLGAVPHLTSSPLIRMQKADFKMFLFLALICASLYAALVGFLLIWG